LATNHKENKEDYHELYRALKTPFILLLCQTLRTNKKLKQFKLYSAVIMPDHVHILLQPNLEIASISEIMRSIKTNSSRDINKYLESAVARPRFHYEIPLFRWHKSFYDHIIRDDKDLLTHIRYIQYNHLKHHRKPTIKMPKIFWIRCRFNLLLV